jgi:beta-glucanase (GH16 family)
MRKFILQIAIMILSYSYSFAQLPSQDSSFIMVFNDEFNGSSLDANKWATNVGWGNLNYKLTCVAPGQVPDTIWYPEYYTPGNNLVYTGNSVKLQVKRQNYTSNYIHHYNKVSPCGSGCPSWGCVSFPSGTDTCYTPVIDTATFKYTSARLVSKKKFKYGYFEIRVKLPDPPTSPANHQGISTNFWLFSADNNVSWSELDIYEINCRDNMYTNNVHFQRSTDTIHYQYPNISANGLLFNNQYKTFSVNWTPDKMDFYMDGNLIRTNTQKCDSLISMPMLIDMNIEGTQFCERVDTVNTVLPYNAEVDYVRVYQLRADCNTVKAYCNNISTHDYKTYKNITIDGGTCVDVLNNKANESYTATDFILIDQGCEIGNNIGAKFEVIKCYIGQDFSNARSGNPPPIEIAPASWYKRLKH